MKLANISIFLFMALAQTAECQFNYPQGYFQWPVDSPPGLAANFGELRPNHFHMGLDCRTNKKENLAVFAAADGYIAKVKIEPGGFGRAIYINHPNGLTTLYAHLNAFSPALENYVKEQQYKEEKWDVFLEIPANIFPVTKGSIIAYSGNTGGSQGPHLHFEIRDTKSYKVFNPLLFGFPLKDNIPPDIKRLVIYDRNLSTYEQVPVSVTLRKKNGIYQAIGPIIVNTDKISFGITAFDRYTGSTNQNGIFQASVSDNGIIKCSFVLDSISYDDTRYLNAHIDYMMKANGGAYVQHLSRLPGYEDGIYKRAGNGVIVLNDKEHSIRIVVADAAGNQSVIQLNVILGTSGIHAHKTGNLFVPGYVNVFDNDTVRLQLAENQLYDSFYFKYASLQSEIGLVYKIHNPTIPVHSQFTLSIKPPVPFSSPGKVVMRRFYGSKEDFSATTYYNGWYSGNFKEFGNYELIQDDIPPVISAVSVSRYSIIFAIADNTKTIMNFTPQLNGKWIRFSNDKNLSYVYTFDEHCPQGQNTLTINCEDLAGNRSEKTINFYR